MHWLTPMAGLIGAAVTVPTLVLLYFLKLRRRELVVSSTFLWKRAVQDLQVNAPFQRLRRNILLLLQLLALLAVLAAMGRPVLLLQEGPGQRQVLLIDRSASMGAVNADGTRLERAKAQARTVVDSMRSAGVFDLGGQADQAMVIAFDDRAKVMCNFTSDKAKLHQAVDAIVAGDGGSSLAEAVLVARAYASPPVEDPEGADVRVAVPSARLELFSDGRISDRADVVVPEGQLHFHCVGTSVDNVGVVAMEARRSYENPDEVTVFAALANAGPTEVDFQVQLSLDWHVKAVRSVQVAPAAPATADTPARPGKASVTFVMTHAAAGVIEVRQLRSDALAADDAAWAILQPPKRLSVALVTAGSIALSEALKACPLARLDVLTPAAFDAADADQVGAYDMIVLDQHSPATLQRGRYLVFGRPPPELEIAAEETKRGEFIVDWAPRHAVLEYVNLEGLYAAKHYTLTLDRDARVLAEFSDSPAMAVVRRAGSTFVLAGFAVEDTNWPFEPGFVMFCYNVASFLGAEVGRGRQTSLRVGQAITLQGAPSDRRGRLVEPDGARTELTCDAAGVFRWPETSRVGVYRLRIADGPEDRFAVNLLDPAESNITPIREIVLAGQQVTAESGAPRRSNREIWPWLVGLALALVCLEWVVYNAKVRI